MQSSISLMVLTLKETFIFQHRLWNWGFQLLWLLTWSISWKRTEIRLTLPSQERTLDVKLLRYQLLRELALRKQQRRLLSLQRARSSIQLLTSLMIRLRQLYLQQKISLDLLRKSTEKELKNRRDSLLSSFLRRMIRLKFL